MEAREVIKTECHHCEADIVDGERKWELIDGHGYLYGVTCEDCAEGAFDRYMESRVE
jgi:hypothetical protein